MAIFAFIEKPASIYRHLFSFLKATIWAGDDGVQNNFHNNIIGIILN
jgi:hypothetical protein